MPSNPALTPPKRKRNTADERMEPPSSTPKRMKVHSNVEHQRATAICDVGTTVHNISSPKPTTHGGKSSNELTLCPERSWPRQRPLWKAACRYRLKNLTKAYGEEVLCRSVEEAYDEFHLCVHQRELRQKLEELERRASALEAATAQSGMTQNTAASEHLDQHSTVTHGDDQIHRTLARAPTDPPTPHATATTAPPVQPLIVNELDEDAVHDEDADAAYTGALRFLGDLVRAKAWNLRRRDVPAYVVRGTPRQNACRRLGERGTAWQAAAAAEHLQLARRRVRKKCRRVGCDPPVYPEEVQLLLPADERAACLSRHPAP